MRAVNMTVIYYKAVRDNIPKIIERSGKKCKFQQLPDEDYLPELEKKLSEELKEYYSSRSIEELADIVEIINRILELRETKVEDFDKIRLDKKQMRGGFSENYFLVEVQENQ